MSEEAGTYLGRTGGGDSAEHIVTMEAMLRVEKRQLDIWQGGSAPGVKPADTRRALAFYRPRVAALEAALKMMQKKGG